MNSNGANRPKLLAVTDEDPQFATALKLAMMAVDGELEDLTDQGTHYFAEGTPTPCWVKGATFCRQIGQHLFYKGIR